MTPASPSYALAIHTSSPDLGFAIASLSDLSSSDPSSSDLSSSVPSRSNLGSDRRSQVWPLGRDISSQLHLYLQTFIQPQTWAELAYLAVAIGPGSFTGTRIGVVTARTLAQQLNIPLFGISTLGAIAWHTATSLYSPDQFAALDHPLHIAVHMAARRQEVYGAIYTIQRSPQNGQATLVALVPDTVFSQAGWQTYLAAHPKPDHEVEAIDGLGESVVSILTLANLAWQQGQRPDWSAVLPTYGQSPV
ncbi:MAG TPA: tRNA (adenosine(37)-N6)-threonylcarbamoyltransferase complex dimerization subunit type 1 TsaB [Candidatus Obscuribacterales bacterium]